MELRGVRAEHGFQETTTPADSPSPSIAVATERSAQEKLSRFMHRAQPLCLLAPELLVVL